MNEPVTVVLNNVFVPGYSHYTIRPFADTPVVLVHEED